MEAHELEGDWPTSPNWGPRYSKENDHSKLRLDFTGSETVENNYSQAFQDMFVLLKKRSRSILILKERINVSVLMQLHMIMHHWVILSR